MFRLRVSGLVGWFSWVFCLNSSPILLSHNPCMTVATVTVVQCTPEPHPNDFGPYITCLRLYCEGFTALSAEGKKVVSGKAFVGTVDSLGFGCGLLEVKGF